MLLAHFNLWPLSSNQQYTKSSTLSDSFNHRLHRRFNEFRKQNIPFADLLLIFIIMSIVKKRRKSGQHVTSDGYSYLTKRLLLTRAKQAGQQAASQAMTLMGYVITVKDGWLIKEYADGQIEQLQKV